MERWGLQGLKTDWDGGCEGVKLRGMGVGKEGSLMLR